MTQPGDEINRADWQAIVSAFGDFFEGMGQVSVTEAAVEFNADGTGLALNRDGTSRSFMPLHDLASVWDRVGFDHTNYCVHIWSENAHYIYRVPPRLIPTP